MTREQTVTKENARAFLDRPWAELAELKERHWREALESDPLATFRISAELWAYLHRMGRTTNDAERQADFDAHRRLRALLDRTAHVRNR